MTVNHLLLTAFYKGWHAYVRYLITAIARSLLPRISLSPSPAYLKSDFSLR